MLTVYFRFVEETTVIAKPKNPKTLKVYAQYRRRRICVSSILHHPLYSEICSHAVWK